MLFRSIPVASALIFIAFLSLSTIGQVPKVELSLGIAALDAKQYSKAIEHLRKAVKTDENLVGAWLGLGVAYVGAEKDKDAVSALEKAVSFDPTNDACHSFLSYALMRRNDLKALQSANKAIDLNPKNAQAQYVLGVMYYRRGSFDLAYERAKLAIENKPDYAGAYLLKYESLLGSYSAQIGTIIKERKSRYSLLADAVIDLEAYVRFAPESAAKVEHKSSLASLKYFVEYYSQRENQAHPNIDPEKTRSSETPLKINRKSPAAYTEQARTNNVSGTVTTLIEFSSSGKIGHVLVVKRIRT